MSPPAVGSWRHWLTAGAAVGGLAVLVLAFVGPLVLSGSSPPPAPAFTQDCPKAPVQLPGAHFTSVESVPDELRCADLRNAVFDDLDLAQRDFRGADLRGASFRHTDLGQADLRATRLGQADLAFADLSQADLSDADLRGASLWLVGSIQAYTSGTRVNVVERGVVQLGYVPVAYALFVVLVALVRMVRRMPGPAGEGQWLRLRTLRALAAIPVSLVVAGALYMVGGNVAALWTVDLVRPFLISAVVLLMAAVVEQFATPKDR